MNIVSIRNLITDKTATEVTRFKGEYWVLHICKNNTPVPLYHSEYAIDAYKYVEKMEEEK